MIANKTAVLYVDEQPEVQEVAGNRLQNPRMSSGHSG